MSQSQASHSTSMVDSAKGELPETGQAASENNYGLMGGVASLLAGLGLFKRSKKEQKKEQSK
ncbi:LPXTG cell wall anchor domain-containing protein [Staphylococcus sp. IVB6246]|uniref:LPXTG cell wall anchor domain-containing protein n=1 Tax=Staphylococcus sp. IVB6246 TaxID=2989772 RepID=UPI0021D25CC3|nr:LPXTG cell wall anchor domain-containing protein [Staphylococcus sp. IVB6246]UXR69728.1 LPXTG cell wall anchor domain-containing protein [Staphylococcus sp. IVB6246]